MPVVSILYVREGWDIFGGSNVHISTGTYMIIPPEHLIEIPYLKTVSWCMGKLSLNCVKCVSIRIP